MANCRIGKKIRKSNNDLHGLFDSGYFLETKHSGKSPDIEIAELP